MTGHGFATVAVAVPTMRVAHPDRNATATLEAARAAAAQGAVVIAFPELGLSGYSGDDLFQQDALLDASLRALESVCIGTASAETLLVVGVPLRSDGRLFNCAAVLHRGRVVGVVPKSYLPNYREFYEKRQFAAARDARSTSIRLLGEDVPFGADLLFDVPALPGLTVHVEICEDVWVPVPPSTFAAMAGATVLVNLSASNVTIGKDAYRRQLCASQSAKLLAAYLYTSAGFGESTTDLAWDGHALIYERGELLAETRRFSDTTQIELADVDVDRLVQERGRMTSFTDCASDHAQPIAGLRRITVDLTPVPSNGSLRRTVERFPFVPAARGDLDDRCAEAFQIQVQGLTTRLAATRIERVVLGVSGGLDSTHALLVACRTMDSLGLPRTNVLGYSMPGFATSRTTRTNADRLMTTLGVTAAEIDIRASATQMLQDIGHPAGDGAEIYDVTYENVQAGERTSHLFRLANLHQALVVGTGDLSELALGWATYGVGDHMSHYNVNASLPKTLISFLVRWVAEHEPLTPEAAATLRAIADTVISPELVPGADRDQPAQRTESIIGPYELHDFFLYYLTRFGFRPSRILMLAHHAWHDPSTGVWPDLIPADRRVGYDTNTIARWLRVFLERFFANQFKRSTVPNGPKVGSGGSLSPRGDWRAPSDAPATVWLNELDQFLEDLPDHMR